MLLLALQQSLLDSASSSSSEASQQNIFFMGWGSQPHAQPPTWMTRVALFVWVITVLLSGMGDPTSSYNTASIFLRVI
jgi:hypothetical protein